MNLDDLKTLLLVRDQGGFAAAARTLDLNPASVSRRVAEIEAGLGLRIFQRSTRRFSVTEAGEAFLTRLAPLLDEFDAALGSAETLSTDPGGTLRMTTSVSFGHEVVMPLLGGFHAAYPGIRVELILSDSNLDLVRDRIDLALRLAPAPAGALISSRILTARYRVVASPAYLQQNPAPARPEDLAHHPALRFPLPGFRDRWMFRDTAGRVTEVPVDGWLICSNALSLRRAALDGLGVALLTDWLVGQSLRDGTLIDLFPQLEVTATGFESGIWALYPTKAYLPQRVRLMIDFIRREAGRAAV
ncbi:LysR family transcriptional regulator [Gemmobacter denitrificans]|uniref:LysR family transcriptional regulator n=1 Tax=Gemmobacter denitrificans TaxID=3123040 RepID=A0ABU8BZT8_9RHOB